MKLTFLGAAGTVTGSKFLLSNGQEQILVDCGLFQGLKNLRLKNWKHFPISPHEIHSVLLTHAHIDHSGYIPKLIKDGFEGKVYCTSATKELCRILLPDSGYLQEEDAKYANMKGFSKHHPALPLYTESEGRLAIRSFSGVDYEKEFKVGSFKVQFQSVGHILGAASIRVSFQGKSVLFSGDVGRPDDLLMHAPKPPCSADYLVVESTYGDRLHPKEDPLDFLEKIFEESVPKKSVVLIPSFAVGRTQTILLAIYKIFERSPHLKVPVYVNSPMATSVTELFQDDVGLHQLDKELCNKVCNLAHFVKGVEDSIGLNHRKGPMIIISASGMITGGRILHHVKQFASDERNVIVLPGYQAAGTRGAALLAGKKELKIHGEYVPIRSKLYHLELLSAHADQQELLSWIGACPQRFKKVYVVHGEPVPADVLRSQIEEKLRISTFVPELGESVDL